jgi:hypothetical protein
MAVVYRVYKNNGAGGAIDYNTVVATVSALTWESPAQANNSNTLWAVRAYDNVSLLEDRNTDARVRVQLDNAYADITAIPNAPFQLSAVAQEGGDVLVSWRYNGQGQGGAPTGFHVYAGTPSISYAIADATVLYLDDGRTYKATLIGLTEVSHEFGVRAYNATGEESNTNVVTLTPDATAPISVGSLTATVIP